MGEIVVYVRTAYGACIVSHNNHIPLFTNGTKIAFKSRVPTTKELNDDNIMRFDLTSMSHWEPTSVRLSEIETMPIIPTRWFIQTVHTHDETRMRCEHMDP